MKRKNLNRNALVTSIISLLLCVSMLVGTTFAWFTDEVVTGRNTIAAGNLDIELLSDGQKVNESTVLFDNKQLWEPGVVVYENLEIANVGTLALKYQLTLESIEENDLNGHKLSEVVKIALVDKIADGATRAEVLAAAKASQKVGTLADFSLEGSLDAGATTGEASVVVFWEPNDNATDNLYNANNGQKTSDEKPLFIEFGVKLFATQQMKEEDSFGPDYDGAAAWTTLADTDWYFADPDAAEFTIYSAEELAGFAALVNGTATAPTTTFAAGSAATVTDSFKGQTVKLGGNIDLAGHPWTPIGNWDNVFEGTFDGQGYTINNLYIKDTSEETGEGVGLFGVAQGATIKGVTVNNVNISAYSMVATVVGAAYPATISDCHVTGSVNIVADWAYVGGISGYNYYGTQIDGCSTVAADTGLIKSNTRNAVGGITAWLLEGDHKVTNCQVKNLDLVGWANIGGITGFVHYSNTIDNCSVENVNLTKTRVDGIATIGMAAGGFSYNAAKASTITNNTFKNITLNGTAVANSGANIMYGGEYGGATTANFVLENNVTENITNNLVEIVKASSTSLKDDVKEAGANVYVPKGTYTFPSGVAAGVTLTCEEGTVFTGVSSLDVNGATVVGATFKNDGSAVKGNTNGTFVDCVFEGSEALRWCYSAAGTTTVFENCVIKTDFRGFHYDNLEGEVIFRNCEINGFNAYGGEGTVTFEDCTFGCDESSYNGLNIYANTNLINCEFVFTSGKTNFIDMEGTGKTLTITNCTATLDGAAADVANFVGGSKLAENTVIYN